MDGSRPGRGFTGSFPMAAGSTPARLVDTLTQDAPESALLAGERFEGADRHEAGNVSQGDDAMYALAVQDRKQEPDVYAPRTRRLFAAGKVAPPPHAQYVLGILTDAVACSSRPSEVTGHLLEVAERATVDGDHSHAAALRDTVERIRAAGPCVALVRQVASDGALVELARKVAEAYPTCSAQVVKELREDALKGTTTELVARVVAADALQWAITARQAVKA